MKTAAKPSTIEAPIITRDAELNKEDNAVFFLEKMEMAKAIITRAGLPKRPDPKRHT